MKRRHPSPAQWTLPRGRLDLGRQLLLLAAVYAGYELVRGLVAVAWPSYKPFGDATRIINFERTLHVFWEPGIQGWVIHHAHWLLDAADWAYINAQFVLTAAVLVFIYLRRNESFYFVRNMFMVAMLIALVGYAVYPTAPPRLMPEWGFTDVVQQVTGVTAEHGSAAALLNLYAAIPSMHVCFAMMTGVPMSRVVRSRWAQAAWLVYPVFIIFVVISTGNHYLTDVVLGAITSLASALLSKQLLARARPDVWAFGQAPA
ncbi:MAG: phosphatase PAP2 family protein [Solirubrobacteraceae bacterium]